LKTQTKKNLKLILIISLFGAILGNLYIAFESGFDKLYPFINGTVSGVLIGGFVGIFELFVFGQGFRKKRFMYILLVRLICYFSFITFTILFVVTLTRALRNSSGLIEAFLSDESMFWIKEGDFVIVETYTLIVSFTVAFTWLINRKMGRGVLLNYIFGFYQKPKEVERIFMFLSINNPRQIASNIGLLKFHKFLNDFVFDITEPVIRHKGKFYEYVDDQIVINWSKIDAFRNSHCFKAFGEIKQKLEELESNYLKEYKFVPEFKAGIHGGTVVEGEIGEIKSEIVFQGDVMNTTARILSKASDLNKECVISKYIMEGLLPQKNYTFESCGIVELRGKQDKVELYTLLENN